MTMMINCAKIGDSILPHFGAACYTGRMPPEVEREIDELPEGLFLKLRGNENLSTYIVWEGGRPAAVFLFSVGRKQLVVVNHVTWVDCAHIAAFAEFVFLNFNGVDVIRFSAVCSDLADIRFPVQRCNISETFFVSLPKDVPSYNQALGKSTRKTINYYTNKLKRDFPSVCFQTCTEEEIREEDLCAIMRLKDMRFREMKVVAVEDPEADDRMRRLAARRGMVTLIRIDGRVCAGTVNFRCGTRIIGNIIAYDSTYSAYRLGLICAYLAICAAIESGTEIFELGSGGLKYKTQLLGVQRDLERMAIYRSKFAMLGNMDAVFKVVAANHARRIRVWTATNRNSFFAKALVNTRYYLKTWKADRRGRTGDER